MFITSKSQLDETWISTANPGVNDFIYGELSNNTPLLEAVINSLTDFSWGIKTFSINPDTHFPLLLAAVQGKQLLEKLVELLHQPAEQLWQRQDTGAWEKRDVELGQKVAQLWRKAQHDTALSQWLFEKLMPQLATQANWINELAVGNTASILDFSLYCDAETKQKIWNMLLKNIYSAQVAAALAEFYAQQPLAQQWFGYKIRFANKLVDACIDDIRWVDNPEYLDSMLEDLYQIEAALNVDIDDAKLLIYRKLDRYEDISDLESDIQIDSTYFVASPSGHIDEALLAELTSMQGRVQNQFEEL